MSDERVFRWLHLSDFHVGKDQDGEKRLFKELCRHVDEQCQSGFVPNVVFLTGDLAYAGKSEQYQLFREQLLDPLLKILANYEEKGWLGRVYAVPGNHDVDRDTFHPDRKTALQRAEEAFLRTNKDGLAARTPLLGRFAGYSTMGVHLHGSPTDWLGAEKPFFVDLLEWHGASIAVAGVNTAWLAQDEHDETNLQVGPEIVEEALEALDKSADVKVLLGHHPLDWMNKGERDHVEMLLGEHHALYLHGHLHEAKLDQRQFRNDKYKFVTVQGGATFQAHNDDKNANEIFWAEIKLKTQTQELNLQPRRWHPTKMWTYAIDRFHQDDIQGNWAVFPLPSAKQLGFVQPAGLALAESAAPFVHTGNADDDNPAEPAGWRWIDGAGLHKQQQPLGDDDLSRFFDGDFPEWRHALSERVPRREIVLEAAKRLETRPLRLESRGHYS